MSVDSAQPDATVESPEADDSDRSPLGREVSESLASRIWLFVLVMAILSVGILQQRVDTYQAFNADRYFVASAITSAVALIVWLGLRFVLRAGTFSSLTGTAVFVLVFFRWPQFLKLAASIGADGIFADLLVVGLAVGVATVLLSRARRSVVLACAVVFALGGMLVAAVPYVQWALEEPRSIDTVEIVPGNGAGDDVVVVLLDAYLREDQLLELMGFDNSRFALELEERGFLVQDDATSNYNLTYGSVASMMALEPPIGAGEMTTQDHELLRFLIAGGGPLFESFHDAGYEITSHVTGWKGSRCSDSIDHCIRDGIVASTAWYLGEITPLAPIIKDNIIRPTSFVGMRQLTSIANTVNEAFSRRAPQLVWEHIELPHPPMHFDAACVLHKDKWRQGTLLSNGDPKHQPRITAYTEQIECVNRLVLEQLDQIITRNPSGRILIVSDHGPSSQGSDGAEGVWNDSILAERLSIITALRAPQTCDRALEAKTLVNTFRRFAACTLDAQVPDTDDRQFIIPDLGNPSDVREVTGFDQ